jgi:tRNA-dihydrouridine synthase
MQNNFWHDIVKKAHDMDRPIFALAPMADVTDCVFRELIAKYSKFGTKESLLDVFWTEFVSADGLCSIGREVLKSL